MIKEWILNRQFVKDALREAEIKAFPKAHADILETLKDDLEERADDLVKERINDLFSTVDWNWVMSADKSKNVYLMGALVESQAKANLIAEAEFIASSELWKIMKETPRELAHRAMFVNGETLADMQKGRAITYTLQAQQNILDILLAK